MQRVRLFPFQKKEKKRKIPKLPMFNRDCDDFITWPYTRVKVYTVKPNWVYFSFFQLLMDCNWLKVKIILKKISKIYSSILSYSLEINAATQI
jgi:hypothetical protein